MAVNGSALDPFSHESWPYDWRTVGLSVERTPLAIDHDDEKSIRESVTTWAGGLLGMVIALLPAEEIIETSTAEAEGLWEGALKRVTVNRYERSRVNRAICIAVHGCTCAACGFDFRYHYGDLGDGFIHVHHVTPVSELGDGYRVDPRRDLVPVCANCHAMLHRRNPPLTVKELSELFTSQARNRAGPLSE